jgi:hypothetical protein
LTNAITKPLVKQLYQKWKGKSMKVSRGPQNTEFSKKIVEMNRKNSGDMVHSAPCLQEKVARRNHRTIDL